MPQVAVTGGKKSLFGRAVIDNGGTSSGEITDELING
jgi:hypothetical protein